MNNIKVAAGVIKNGSKYLIAKRKEGKHLAGFWEFPGGKIEKNETPQQCLIREFFEEFEVKIEVGDFIMEHTHKYPEKEITLYTYFVSKIKGEYILYSHSELRWIELNESTSLQIAPADRKIINKLKQDD